MRKLGQPEGESPLLTFRVTDEMMKLLKHLAKCDGVSVSEYARQCLDLAIRGELRRADARRAKK